MSQKIVSSDDSTKVVSTKKDSKTNKKSKKDSRTNQLDMENDVTGPIFKRVYSRNKVDDIVDLVDYVKNSHVNVRRKILLSSILITSLILVTLVITVLLFLNFGKVDKIEIDKSTLQLNYDVEADFAYGDIDLLITHLSGRTVRMSLSSSMISAEDNAKLKKVGNHQITVNYGGKQTKFYVTIVKMYDVVFTVEGSSFAKEIRVVSGTGLTEDKIPAVPAKDGYTGYWDKTAEDLAIIISNVRVNAIYRPNAVGVTFPGNEDDLGRRIYELHTQEESAYVDASYYFTIKLSDAYSRSIDTIVVKYNGVELSSTKNGDILAYRIDRVSVDGGEVTFENCNPNAYLVNYYLSADDENPFYTKEVGYKEPIMTGKPNDDIVPVPDEDAKYRYEFAYWGTDPDSNYSETPTDKQDDTEQISTDVNLYAKYKPILQVYTISFRDPTLPYNQDRICADVRVNYDQVIRFTDDENAQEPFLTDSNGNTYVFDHWDVVVSGVIQETIDYDGEIRISDYYTDTKVKAGNINLYVAYREVKYVVRLYLDKEEIGEEIGVYVIGADKTYGDVFGVGKTIELITKYDTKEYSYSYIVWYKDENGNGLFDAEEDSELPNASTPITDHIQLVADFVKDNREYEIEFLQEDGTSIGTITYRYEDEIELQNEIIDGIIKAKRDKSRAFKEWLYGGNTFVWAEVTDDDVLDGIIELQASYDEEGTREYTIVYKYQKTEYEFDDDSDIDYDYTEEVEHVTYNSEIKTAEDVECRTIQKIYSLLQWNYKTSAEEPTEEFVWDDVIDEDVEDGIIELVAKYDEGVIRKYKIYLQYAQSIADIVELEDVSYGVAIGGSSKCIQIGDPDGYEFDSDQDIMELVTAYGDAADVEHVNGKMKFKFESWQRLHIRDGEYADLFEDDHVYIGRNTLDTFKTTDGDDLSGILFVAKYKIELYHRIYFHVEGNTVTVPDGCAINIPSNMIKDGDDCKFYFTTDDKPVRIEVYNDDTSTLMYSYTINANTVDYEITIPNIKVSLFIGITELED